MRQVYDSDISREQFVAISQELESTKKKTRPREVDLYEIFCAVALGRKILTIIYAILKSGQEYDEGHFEEIREYYKRMRLERMASELTQAGFSVVPK